MEDIDAFSLQGKLLVSTPDMSDSRFKRSVIFICVHEADHAMGLVINKVKPGVYLSDILKCVGSHPEGSESNVSAKGQLSLDTPDLSSLQSSPEFRDQIVLDGGPVGVNQGFVLHTPLKSQPEPSRKRATLDLVEPAHLTTSLSPTLVLSANRQILRVLASNSPPEKSLLVLGYTGWASGQLEQEIINNSWIVVDADDALIFDDDYESKWCKALSKLGISPEQISALSGLA